jgi:XrtJ-associated TM-motif-TM protein
MKKPILALLSAALLLAVALPLRAQTGCSDSPEDPTLILALVGGAAAIATTLWNSHRRKL